MTRAAILSRAAAMASVHGLEGLSIGRLATTTKLSKSGLFGHFGSKEALQRAVLEHVVEDFRNRVILPALRPATGVERLTALFTAWLDWSEDAPARAGGCPLLGATIELDDRPGALRDYLVDRQKSWLDGVARMATRAIADGDFEPTLDTAQFAFEFNNLGLGFHFAHRLLGDPDARRHARNAFERLLRSAHAAWTPRRSS